MPKESRWGIAARPRVPGASGQYWCVSVRSGSISPPAIPGIRPCPLCRFPARRRPLARQRCAQLLGDVRSVPGFGTKSLPPGVVTPLNCSFTPRSRGAVLVCWEWWRRAFLSRRKISADTCVTLHSLKRLSLPQALGRWVPWIAELTKRVRRAPKAKAPTPVAQFQVPPPLGAFLALFSPAICGFPAHPAASPSPELREAEGSREPARWRLQTVATLGWGKTRCPRPSLPPAKCQVCHGALWVRFSSIHVGRQASLSLPSPPPHKIL